MLRLWNTVKATERSGGCGWGGGGAASEAVIDSTMLTLAVEQGHSAIEPDDDPGELIEAMVLVRDTLNSNRDLWDETFGLEEGTLAAQRAEGDRIRAAREAAAGAEA